MAVSVSDETLVSDVILPEALPASAPVCSVSAAELLTQKKKYEKKNVENTTLIFLIRKYFIII